MKNLIAAVVLGLTLSACGQGEADPDLNGVSQKAAKFKGAKLAPPQDIINEAVANEWFDRRGYLPLIDKVNCKNASAFRPQDWSAECASAVAAWKDKTVFTPSECRKGDERDGYTGILIQPVSCTGLLEDPRGQEQYIFVFHKPDGEWKAWIGPSFPGTRKNR